MQTSCKLRTRPSVAILQLRLLFVFGTCTVISSWCWTSSTFKTWRRFVRKYEHLDDYAFGIYSFVNSCRKMGHEVSDDERFTKPKHKVIADAYAKRMEGVISVSIENANTDPAGLNFDMNDLNSTGSNGMGATLTNYLCNIIHRRNAVTSLDFSDCGPHAAYGNSCDSEISVSVRHVNVSVESRRSSVDSQVSLKMSETEIKAKVESRSQKHKSMSMRTKNRRNCYATSRRSTRRTSTSSVESQIISAALRKSKCKIPGSKIRLNSSAIAGQLAKNRQTERRSACAGFDLTDLSKLQNNINLNSLTTSEEEGVDKALPSLEPSSVLVPFTGDYPPVENDSSNSQEMANVKCDRGDPLRGLGNLPPLIQSLLLQSTALDKIGHKASRSSKSRQSQWQRSKGTNAGDIFSSSVSSSVDLEVGAGNVHSSYSGNSVGGNKTHSRNSKASCDVGIQANAYDISSHARYDDLDNSALTEVKAIEDDDEDHFTETHKLVPSKKRESMIVSRKDTIGLSDSEKLRMLLLPKNS